MIYNELINKIEQFIRKYYLNKIVRGAIWLCAIFLICFLAIIIAEYFGYFGVVLKTTLFYLFALSQAILAWFLILRHAKSYLKLGQSINHQQAAVIIGKHFPEVADKLTNTLQLQKILEENPEKSDLIYASINQKVTQLQPVPFVSAIKISENKKYLYYAAIPIAIILVLAFSAPSILSEGTTRMIEHDKYFVKKAPFNFNILNNTLNGVEGEDFMLKIKLTGDQIPQDIYLEDGSNSFKLEKEDIIHFNYTFKNLRESKSFRFKAGEYYSAFYKIDVKKKPALLNITAKLVYPKYTQLKNKTLDNPGDLTIPAGTAIYWDFKTENASALNLKMGQQAYSLKPLEANHFQKQVRLLESISYSLEVQNQSFGQDAVNYRINVIPDAFPQIQVDEKADSLNSNVLYFIGKASDDYGISNLRFYYQISKSENKDRLGKKFSSPVKFSASTQSNFFFFWPLKNLGIQAGEEVSYYFEVTDNDAVNRAKKARSDTKTYKLASKEEAIAKIDERSNTVKQDIQAAIKQAQKIQADAKKLNQELKNTNIIDLEQKKQASELFEKQQRLEDLLKKISDENKKNLLDRQQLKEDKELLEKQKQIQDLFENVLNDKTKELLKDLQKMLDQKNEVPQQNMQQLQTDNKSLQKELDRILELYKKLEVEQKINQSIEDLKELAAKQKENIQEKSKEKQEEIAKDFTDIKKDLKEADDKNKALENAENFNNPEQKQKEIADKLQEATENLKDNKKQKAQDAQQNAAQKMQELAKELEEMQQEDEEEESKINQQELRQLLQNLLKSSFDEEKVMLDVKNIDPSDPRFKEVGQKQRNIQDNLKMVEDSLYSLSRRVPQISSTVNTEIKSINQQLNAALENISERKSAEAYKSQQYALTSINNLSLMLSEALQQLQNAQKKAKSGGGKGKPQPGMGELSKMQQELSKNMQKAKEQMQQEGGANPGRTRGKQISESFAKMAQQQQMIRQALQELNQKFNKDGKGKLGNLEKIMQEMEQTETDLVNKRITQEALLRQQDIQQKLLEAEKAERERDLDTQKESKAGKTFAPNYDMMLKEYNKIRSKEVEIIKSISPELKNFYKSKISEYFKKINTEN